MYDISHKDFTLLLNVLDAISKIKTYSANFSNADEFYNETKTFDAVMMNFVVIGEISNKLSDDFRAATSPEINWLKVIGLRNIIAHNYFGIDAEEVWQIMGDTLIDLDKKLKQLLNN